MMGGNDHTTSASLRRRRRVTATPTDGIRQFVVGTGGRFLRLWPERRREQRGARNPRRVPSVDLLEEGYDWEFVPVEGGRYTDTGTTACH